jgi:hypothetical protein
MHSVTRNREKYIERGERERTGREREREGDVERGRWRVRERERATSYPVHEYIYYTP